jgi:tetratricopeptide (TPR) repeat protein
MKSLPQIEGVRLIEELGTGAVGRVFAAELTEPFTELEPGRKVALKIIRPNLLEDRNARARFERELKIGTAVVDEHLMRMYGEGRTREGWPYVVMELLEGEPLDLLIREAEGPLSVDRTVNIALGTARGLKALHDRGIIHRDLKPSNVMVLPSGEVKLMDYGLARMLDVPTMLTSMGTFVGTFHYSSPEQFGGKTGIPSDLWSLGVILYEMLAGNLPFDYKTIPEVMSAIQNQQPLPVKTANPLVPSNLSEIVQRLLEKNIQHRLASADEVISALEGSPGPALKEFLASSQGLRDKKRISMESVLPFAVGFQGRDEERRQIMQRLLDPNVSAVVVTGIKGLGKSALVAEVAREARDRFERGGIYFDLRRDGLNWATMVDHVFRDLNYDAQGQLAESALMNALTENPCLLVIDSGEVFEMTDWEGLSRFLKMVEQRRTQNGFDSFPSAVLVTARVVPMVDLELSVEEIPLNGLSDKDGAELLLKLVRDQGPDRWASESEREWVSNRVGGHPEMLRLIAQQARRQDYQLLRKGIASIRGKVLERIEEVLDWSVGRLGNEGRALVPFLACFRNLSFEGGELAAASGMATDSLEFEEGLEQILYSTGLVHWDHYSKSYKFHASLMEWTRQRLEDTARDRDDVSLLDESGLLAAHGRVAEYWESRFTQLPDEPGEVEHLKPILRAIDHRILKREPSIALDHFLGYKFPTAEGGERGEMLWKVLQRFGLYSIILSIAQRLVTVADRENDPKVWAQALNSLGVAWIGQLTGDRSVNLKKAIRCHELALEVYTRDETPSDWARTMNNLGNAWGRLPTGDRNRNLTKAIRCRDLALEVQTKDEEPYSWAGTMNNQGNALVNLSTGDRDENIRKAIECYSRSLEIRTREAVPFSWAQTIGNLGGAWLLLPTGDREENVEKAIRCYEQSLEVFDKESAPFDWARTMENLGNAWLKYPSGDRGETVRKAIRCFERSLEVYTREAAPFDWARATNDLAVAWRENVAGNHRINLNRAVDLHNAAMEVHTSEKFPENHAEDLQEFGLTWLAYAELVNTEIAVADYLEKAIDCIKSALAIWTEEDYPHEFSKAEPILERALEWRKTGKDPGDQYRE